MLLVGSSNPEGMFIAKKPLYVLNFSVSFASAMFCAEVRKTTSQNEGCDIFSFCYNHVLMDLAIEKISKRTQSGEGLKEYVHYVMN